MNPVGHSGISESAPWCFEDEGSGPLGPSQLIPLSPQLQFGSDKKRNLHGDGPTSSDENRAVMTAGMRYGNCTCLCGLVVT